MFLLFLSIAQFQWSLILVLGIPMAANMSSGGKAYAGGYHVVLGPIPAPAPMEYRWRAFALNEDGNGWQERVKTELNCLVAYDLYKKHRGKELVTVYGADGYVTLALRRAMQLMRPDLHPDPLLQIAAPPSVSLTVPLPPTPPPAPTLPPPRVVPPIVIADGRDQRPPTVIPAKRAPKRPGEEVLKRLSKRPRIVIPDGSELQQRPPTVIPAKIAPNRLGEALAKRLPKALRTIAIVNLFTLVSPEFFSPPFDL